MPRRIVVVVEDEPVQRMEMVAVFTEHGFETVEFANAEEAASYITAHSDEVLAVFTDVRMGGDLDGINLVAQISFGCPQIALLVTSGQSEGVLERLPPNGLFVPKPWSPGDLAHVVEHLRPSAVAC